MISSIFALVAAVTYGGLALVHIYWAFGGYWPGRSEETLARTIVGGPPGMRMPSPLVCLGVALVLIGAAWVVVAASNMVESMVSPGVCRGLAFFGAFILLLRGVGGFFEVRFRPLIRGSRYERLNTVLYSPVSLVLAVLTLVSARG
jgi:hypothetical protein